MPDENTTTAEDTPQATDEQTTEAPATDDLGDAGKRALDAERTRAKEAEKRSKALERELEHLRQERMSESEKAVVEAKAAGRAEALTEMGQRLARSEFVGAAARRNPDYDATAVLDDLNLTRYVGEDGEPDSKAITAAVERLVPESSGPHVPSFDGGTRTSAPSSTASQFAKAIGGAFNN